MIKQCFFECTFCGLGDVRYSQGLDTPASQVCCSNEMKLYKIKYKKTDNEDHSIKSKYSFDYIAPFHGHIEFGMKGGPQEVVSKRQLENYAKENGKIWASDKEIEQEAKHQLMRRNEESDRRVHRNVKEAMERIYYEIGKRG